MGKRQSGITFVIPKKGKTLPQKSLRGIQTVLPEEKQRAPRITAPPTPLKGQWTAYGSAVTHLAKILSLRAFLKAIARAKRARKGSAKACLKQAAPSRKITSIFT
jgi:hypothetical protein